MNQHKRGVIDFNDPRRTTLAPVRSRGELPHLYKEGGSYFITFRLRDAVCSRANTKHRQEARNLVVQPSRPYVQRAAREIALVTEPALDLGSCILRRADAAGMVQRALLHFEAQRYQLAAWCVMPNHVHVAYTALGEHTPGDIHHSWKSYTSHAINTLLRRRGVLWERESFDHLIRSIEHYEAFVSYIEQNPVEAGLCATPEEWTFSSAVYFRG